MVGRFVAHCNAMVGGFGVRFVVCLSVALTVSFSASAQATNVYVTPGGTATGNCPTGTSTAPNLTPSGFNNSSNWGTGASQIGPGTTVLLCGTLTGTAGQSGLLHFQSSGTSANPITLKFDANANITAPYWGYSSSAAIGVGQNYIVIDGGTNGIVQNTANGSSRTYNVASTAVYISGSNVTVQNLTISNICVHNLFSDTGGCTTSGTGGYAIYAVGGDNITIHSNIIHDAYAGAIYGTGGTNSNITFSGNTIYNCNWGIAVFTNSGQTLNGVTVTGNNIHDGVNWDDSVDAFHHNGIFVFQGNGGTINNVQLSDNYIHGDWGLDQTGYIFFDPNNGGTINHTRIFNNLLINESTVHGPGNGYITGLGNTDCAAYNNLIFGNGLSIGYKSDHPCTFENNIVSSVATGIYTNSGTTLIASDYNNFYNLTGGSSSLFYAGTNYSSVATWTKGTGFDSHSVTGDPKLNAGSSPPYLLQSGSAAAGAGTNLSSLGINALDRDRLGNLRPTSGAWDLGPYLSGISSTVIVPPTGLVAIVQ